MGGKLKKKFATSSGPSFIDFLRKHQKTRVVNQLPLAESLKVYVAERNLRELDQWDQVQIKTETASSGVIPEAQPAAASSSSALAPPPTNGISAAVSVGGTHSVSKRTEFFEPFATTDRIALDGRDRGLALIDDDGGVVMLELQTVDPFNSERKSAAQSIGGASTK